MSKTEISIIVPTWNEAGNIGLLIEQIRLMLSDHVYEVIVVDDGSPDGTADVVLGLIELYPDIQLIQRDSKQGLASAIIAGSDAATGSILVMMDADLSHDPGSILELVTQITSGYDVATGSRYVKGSKIIGLSLLRVLGSCSVTIYARMLLGLWWIRDPLTGFAAFRREILQTTPMCYSSRGFKLLLELLVTSPGLKVKEVPILFRTRLKGSSKMNVRELWRFIVLCNRLFFWRLTNRRT